VLDFSPIQILIVLVIALIVFGPKRLPEMGRSIGRGIREFKGAIMDDGSTAPVQAPEPARPATTATTAAPATATAAVAAPEDDDILEGIVVPGDTPPAPDAPPASPRAPDA
jgi:sec-independent protein translocase protein TatA